jgi:hypothetical protein
MLAGYKGYHQRRQEFRDTHHTLLWIAKHPNTKRLHFQTPKTHDNFTRRNQQLPSKRPEESTPRYNVTSHKNRPFDSPVNYFIIFGVGPVVQSV